MTAGGLDFVYFSGTDWGSTWQRPQQMASRLAHRGRVLYVDPLGLRAPRLGDWRRLGERLAAAWTRGPRRPLEQLTVHHPVAYWPFPDGGLARRINARLLRRAVLRWMEDEGVTAPVLWVGTPSPSVLEAVQGLRSARIAYDCLDDVAAFHGGRASIVAAERACATEAGVVWCTSKLLLDRMRTLNPRSVLLPNAADVDHFRAALSPDLVAPPELRGLGPPVFGYVGEIAEWFDTDAVAGLARACPRAAIALVGPVRDRSAARVLTGFPNVRLLGPRSYAELPRYLKQFSVCLLPFRRTPLTAAVNPVKLYEYLAAGKPVVSTPLPEVLAHADVVTVAEPEGFPAAVAAALAAGEEGRARRLARAEANTWGHRIAEVLRVLASPGPNA